MSCFHPLYGYKSSSGKWLSQQTYHEQEPMTVPCGQCTGCRTEYSRQWALRNMHEASLNKNNCFITLTYNEKNLPQNNSLEKKAFPKFIRSLRQKNKETKIRYYACGEYGDNFGRPHYHAILFNYFPSDVKPLKKDLYTSKSISDAWRNKGHVSVGNVTFQSAAYVSNYVQKKIMSAIIKQHTSFSDEKYCKHDFLEDYNH